MIYFFQLYFVENVGQYSREVLYKVYPYEFKLTKDRIILNDAEIIFYNSNPNVKITASEVQGAIFNYIIGNDRNNWKFNIPSYRKLVYKDIYRHTDLILLSIDGGLEFQFVLKPGSNPQDIKLRIIADKYRVENDRIIIEKEGKEVYSFSKLMAYQGSDSVDIKFKLVDDFVTYNIGKYDKSDILIIDPVLSQLASSTYIGGSFNDGSYDGLNPIPNSSIYKDNNGNVFITGFAYSYDYPTTSNAYQTMRNGSGDVVISKFNNNLSVLLSSTYLGGMYIEFGTSIVVDNSGYVYVTGYTASPDFPIINGYDNTYNETTNCYDGFVVKMDNNLSTVVSSTYIGSSTCDYPTGIKINNNGVYIVGFTSGNDFPIVGGFQASFGGGSGDAFVARFNNNLSSLLSSTYLGGSNGDYSSSLVIDNSGNVYVTGWTYSYDFPVTPWAYDNQLNPSGFYDVFVSKLNYNLSQLSSSTFIGGLNDDVGYSINIDNSGNIYITGYTMSSDFPTTSNAYDNSPNGYQDAFISVLNSDLSNLISSTYLGGYNTDIGYSIYVGNDGYVYVCGSTFSTNFPILDGYQNALSGQSDIFISKASLNLSSLSASTFLGGSNIEVFCAIFVDNNFVYVMGATNSEDFPTKDGYDGSYNGSWGYDMFVSKFGSSTVANSEKHSSNNYKIQDKKIIFEIFEPTYIGINVYKLDGSLERRISYGLVTRGIYSINLEDLSVGTYILNIRLGNRIEKAEYINKRR